MGRQPCIAFTNNHSKFLQRALHSPAPYSAFPLLPVSLLASATLQPFSLLSVASALSMVTVFVNGIPSLSKIILVDVVPKPPPGLGVYLTIIMRNDAP